jgi:uncharacterized linocin/CFP29 family protein
MDPALENLGWTEEMWNRLCSTVTEEAQKARVAAQMLPVVGPEDPSTVALPQFVLQPGRHNPIPPNNPQGEPSGPSDRLSVNSDPTLFLTTISVNVQLRTTEAADPNLGAALVMFRRAANHIARIEDALVFNGRPADGPPLGGLAGVPPVFTVTGHGEVFGIMEPDAAAGRPIYQKVEHARAGEDLRGQPLVNAVVEAINTLEQGAQLGPYACVLGHELFEDVCNPTANLVLPRDRILPFLQGPLLRSSAIPTNHGALIALSGSPVELVVACDIDVRFLQTTLEPRMVFRVSERVAVRIKDPSAIALLRKP